MASQTVIPLTPVSDRGSSSPGPIEEMVRMRMADAEEKLLRLYLLYAEQMVELGNDPLDVLRMTIRRVYRDGKMTGDAQARSDRNYALTPLVVDNRVLFGPQEVMTPAEMEAYAEELRAASRPGDEEEEPFGPG